MTRELIDSRIADLRRQLAEAQARLFEAQQLVYHIDGALQDCEYWLTQVPEAPRLSLVSPVEESA